MTSRENAHSILPRYLLAPGAISATNTGGFDTLNAESAMICYQIAPANFGAAIGATLTLQESDALASGYTAVDPMFVEWFQNGVPGNVVAGVWTPGVPGYTGALAVIGTGLDASFVYSVSYVGGQHRYIRLNVALTGAPTNQVAALGMLGNPRATVGRIFTNYANDLGLTVSALPSPT